jgi:hypothetical protein
MGRKIRSESELRRHVEKILACPVPEWAWKIAGIERWVSEVLKGEEVPENLANRLKQYMDTGGPQVGAAPEFLIQPRRQRRAKTVGGRQKALSEALAEIARQSDEVQWFRSRILNGRTLTFQEVEKWIEEHRQDGAYPHVLLVRIKRNSELFHRAGRQRQGCLCSVEPDEIEGTAPVEGLYYAKPDGNAGCVPVARDGTLRVVYETSQALAGRFLWEEAQATMFLLTDIIPLISTQHVQFRPAARMALHYKDHPVALSCLMRVTLTIDPMMVPREVAALYRKVRPQLFDQRMRTQSAKHLRLAVFAIKHPTLDKAAMTAWQQKFPAWKYSHLKTFVRDARIARDRLLHHNAVAPLMGLAKVSEKPTPITADEHRS